MSEIDLPDRVKEEAAEAVATVIRNTGGFDLDSFRVEIEPLLAEGHKFEAILHYIVSEEGMDEIYNRVPEDLYDAVDEVPVILAEEGLIDPDELGIDLSQYDYDYGLDEEEEEDFEDFDDYDDYDEEDRW